MEPFFKREPRTTNLNIIAPQPAQAIASEGRRLLQEALAAGCLELGGVAAQQLQPRVRAASERLGGPADVETRWEFMSNRLGGWLLKFIPKWRDRGGDRARKAERERERERDVNLRFCSSEGRTFRVDMT